MKQLLIYLTAILLISCSGQPKDDKYPASAVSAPKTEEKLDLPKSITLGDLKEKYGIDLLNALNAKAKGGNSGKTAATVTTLASDLTLTVSGTDYTTTLPANATFGGVQKATVSDFSDLGSACNWYVAGQSLSSKTCSDNSGATWHRSWSSDASYNVHLSAFINQ